MSSRFRIPARANGFALGLDIRLPTGDEDDLLGTGAPGLRPFAIWSGALGPVAPDANFGCLWNGSSVLAAPPAAGVAADLPDRSGPVPVHTIVILLV